MFVGREQELATLERLYQRGGFQMVILYGRRRVGKTTLLGEFSRGHHVLSFTAQEKSAEINLRSFSRTLYEFFGLPASSGAFASWPDALSYLARQAAGQSEPLLLIFDEFPYAALAEPSLPSALQIAIDHELIDKNVMLVLSGSNEGFMEGEVLGRKSPLFGRRTAQIHLEPFDYLDAARLLGPLEPSELITYYATFGGTPYYLARIDSAQAYEENVRELIFGAAGILYEEPLMLLRQELREPALYSSVLDAVAAGSTTPKRIAERAGVEQNSVGKYLRTLEGLGIILRETPFGDGPRSRKASYQLRDPFFAYWYRFVSPNMGAIEAGAGDAVAERLASGQALDTYVGKQFERICLQWVMRRNRRGGLPFLATSFGRWWGTDPRLREQVDIDLVAADAPSGTALLGECKWRESFDESKAIETLASRAELLPDYGRRFLALFSKRPLSAATRRKAACRDDLLIVDATQLFD